MTKRNTSREETAGALSTRASPSSAVGADFRSATDTVSDSLEPVAMAGNELRQFSFPERRL
jgi:hypothetical protein